MFPSIRSSYPDPEAAKHAHKITLLPPCMIVGLTRRFENPFTMPVLPLWIVMLYSITVVQIEIVFLSLIETLSYFNKAQSFPFLIFANNLCCQDSLEDSRAVHSIEITVELKNSFPSPEFGINILDVNIYKSAS